MSVVIVYTRQEIEKKKMEEGWSTIPFERSFFEASHMTTRARSAGLHMKIDINELMMNEGGGLIKCPLVDNCSTSGFLE
jgi:hypothetical protein